MQMAWPEARAPAVAAGPCPVARSLAPGMAFALRVSLSPAPALPGGRGGAGTHGH